MKLSLNECRGLAVGLLLGASMAVFGFAAWAVGLAVMLIVVTTLWALVLDRQFNQRRSP